MRISLKFSVLALLAAHFLVGCSRSAAPDVPTPSVEQIKQLRAHQMQQETPPSVVRAMAALPVREWGIKETAVDAIARIGEPAVPTLVQLLKDPDASVRVQAARALARMGDQAKPALPALVAALDDRDETVRVAAVRAIGQMGPAAADAMPALVEILKAPDAK